MSNDQTATSSTDSSWRAFVQKASLKTKIVLGMLLLCGTATLVLSLWIIWKVNALHRRFQPAPARVVSATPEANLPRPVLDYELKDVGLSFVSEYSSRIRHVQCTLIFEPVDAETFRWLELNRAMLLDAVHSVGATTAGKDEKSPQLMARLKRDLLRQIHSREPTIEGRLGVRIVDWVEQ